MSTADDVRVKPIPITLDKERNLFFDFNSLIELEDIYGSIPTAMAGIKNLKIRNIRDMIWAGLLHEEETLTQKQVGKWLNMGNLEPIAETIMKAMGIQMPKPEGTAPKPGE